MKQHVSRGRTAGARLGAGLATVALAALTGLAVAPTAFAADAPTYDTTAVVTSVTADGGIELAVTGSGYTALPAAAPSGDPAVGVMVLLRDTATQDDAFVNANGRSLGGQLTMVDLADIADGAWSTTLKIAPAAMATLSPTGTYQVVVWPQRSMLTPASLVDEVDVSFTVEQLALFGASPAPTTTATPEPAAAILDATPISVPVTPEVQCRVENVPGTAGTPALAWGVRGSFVQYVEGAGGGTVTTSGGAARAGDRFTWGAGSGALAADGSGTVSFPGSVHLTAHDGAMDLTLSHIKVTVKADGTGSLVADVASKDLQGNDVSARGVAFASLAFSSMDPVGAAATVTLSEAGAAAFAGFYKAGERLDPLTISVAGATAASTVERCYDAAGNLVNKDGSPINAGLASTGIPAVALGAIGGTAVLLGALVLLWARDRRFVRNHG